MGPHPPPTIELILTPSTSTLKPSPSPSLSSNELDPMLQPGCSFECQGHSYIVIERRHQYQFKTNGYQLHKITLHVQPRQSDPENSRFNDHWVMGDVSCRFNARSEFFRCAVNPKGPCHDCSNYQPVA